MAKKITQVTTWEYCGLIMSKSSYGAKISYIQWCQFEAARMSAASGLVHFVERKTYGDVDYCRVSIKSNQGES